MCLLFAGAAEAQGIVRLNGPLSDRDFYRAVSCGALPSAECAGRLLRWPPLSQRRVSISLAGVQGSGPHFVSRVRNALEYSIAEINRAQSGIRLRYFFGPESRLANIRLFIVQPVGPEKKIERLSYPPLVGRTVDPSTTVVQTLGTNILSAGIALELDPALSTQLRPIIMHEILKALGLVWSLDNTHYDGRSVFSTRTFAYVNRLRDQDLLALLLHYPR